jgi:hypothetical protein
MLMLIFLPQKPVLTGAACGRRLDRLGCILQARFWTLVDVALEAARPGRIHQIRQALDLERDHELARTRS